MFRRGRSFIQNYKQIPVGQRKEYATNARKKLRKMDTPDQPFWQKIKRAIPIGTMVSEYIIEFSRNFLITVARRLGALHGQRSAENVMDRFPGQQRQDTSNPGPANPGPSNPGPANPGPSIPGPSNPGPANPGPSDGLEQGPANPGPSDGLEQGRQPTGGRYELHEQRHEEPQSITVAYNDRNRAKFLEYFIGLELENYTMLDIIKLAENEFKVYQATKISYESYMLQFDDSDNSDQ
jgi:hypothetical protein